MRPAESTREAIESRRCSYVLTRFRWSTTITRHGRDGGAREAQFIKNPQAHALSATPPPAPFKIATPQAEGEQFGRLWALCSVAAPGLFPRIDRHRYYRHRSSVTATRPAARYAADPPAGAAPAQSEVAADLTAKKEQVSRSPVPVSQGFPALPSSGAQKSGLLGDMEKERLRSSARGLVAAGQPGVAWSRTTPRRFLDQLDCSGANTASSRRAPHSGVQPVHRFLAALAIVWRRPHSPALLDAHHPQSQAVVEEFKPRPEVF